MISEKLPQIIALDAAGFLIKENESEDEFLQRVESTYKVYADFDEKLADGRKVKVFDLFEVSSECRISPELSGEAARITGDLYGFAVDHVPGFYLTRQIGLLWGGCLIGDPEQNFAVFLLRNAFRKHRKFLNYRREELLAHELCHSVRHVMEEPTLEEYFAYQTSPSALRRYLGNCFISDRDAWGFLIPVMLLPFAELVKALWMPGFPSWIFWILAVVYPVYLLLRNSASRRLVNLARKKLKLAGVRNPEAVLFRCMPDEIKYIGKCDREKLESWVWELASNSVRWQVIFQRFFRDDAPVVAEDKKDEN